jgi:DNA-directed RNA polymerase, mitochondrial
VRTTLGAAAGRTTLHKAAMSLTEVLEAELIADQFETVNGALYRAVIRNAQARGLSPSRQMKAVLLANRRFNLVDKPWTLGQRAQLGAKLIELFIEAIGIVRVFTQRKAAATIGHYVEFTEEIDAWMKKYNAAATLARPLRLPTVVPPNPWTSVRGGGYFTGRPEPLVTKAFPGQMEALEKADLSVVFKGLNGLQDTPWRVNKRVLAASCRRHGRKAWKACPCPGASR